MADLRIRNIDDVVVTRLQAMAAEAGFNTLEPYLRNSLTEQSKSVMQESYEELTELRKQVWRGRPPLPTGTVTGWIREDRDRRG